MVLGHSRYLWAQYVLHQDLPAVLRCHMEAFEHFGGVPREILYDRMKTAVLGEPDEDKPIVYNAKLLACGAHYGFVPRACHAYERCAMVMTGSRDFGEWADIFGDAVVATALLDRLLHHAVVIPIEGNSYRLREHAALIPEHMRGRMLSNEMPPMPPIKRRPGRPRKEVEVSM